MNNFVISDFANIWICSINDRSIGSSIMIFVIYKITYTLREASLHVDIRENTREPYVSQTKEKPTDFLLPAYVHIRTRM